MRCFFIFSGAYSSTYGRVLNARPQSPGAIPRLPGVAVVLHLELGMLETVPCNSKSDSNSGSGRPLLLRGL